MVYGAGASGQIRVSEAGSSGSGHDRNSGGTGETWTGALADGASADVFIIYSCKAFPERNATHEVGKYAPGYVTFGDNGGGSALMLRGGPGPSPVYLVGHGVMSPKFMEEIAPSFSAWIATGCPLEEQ